MQTVKTGILVYDNCTASMVLGVSDILSLANARESDQGRGPIFDLEMLSETGGRVNSFSRFAVPADRNIHDGRQYDLIYIPGFMGDLDEVLEANAGVLPWLRKQTENGAILTAACNGNFLVAETGLYNNKKATTHWNLIDEFRRRYYQVELQPERILVDNGNTISAAGVTAYFNLALFLIERYGSKELALTCAKIFLVDSGRKIQKPYQMYHISKSHGDEEIARTQDWLERHFQEPVTLDDLVDISNLGKKTFMRRFKKVTGETPLLYLQKLRIENAKRLLESKSLSFNEVTWEVGYSDVSSFHKAFKSHTGLTPIEYRARFSMV